MKKVLPLLLLIIAAGVGYYFYSSNQVKSNSVTKNEPASENTAKKKETESTINPAIWSLEHNGKTSYLFGSIHLGDKSFYPLPSRIMDAFNNSDTLAVEVNLEKVNMFEMAQMVQTMGMDKENPLPTVLSKKTNAEYEKYCKKPGAQCAMLNMFEPWMASMTVESMVAMTSGFSENYGIDKFFLKKAKESKTEIIELESINSQLTLLDEMPLKLQDLMFYGSISRDETEFGQLVDAWKNGTLDAFMKKAEAESLTHGFDKKDLDQLNDLFLYKRNQTMADGIDATIQSGKTVFAVVGAAHYAGQKSVIDYLEEKGYTVTRF